MNKKILQAIAWLVLILGLIAVGCSLGQNIEFRPAALAAEAPAQGIGRASAKLYTSPVCSDSYHSIAEYTEGDGNPPAWYNPDEEMAAEWYAPEPHPPVGIDQGGIDYNICSTVWGWDGHGMEVWELETFARIVYLEFNGVEPECMNAGIDSILNLWNSGYFGRTIFETLSATAENGALVYTTYGYVWDWDYDYSVLEEIKTICAERFMNGPQY